MDKLIFTLEFNEDERVFKLGWEEDVGTEEREATKLFSVVMLPETFEQFANDMLRASKDYKLAAARKYLQDREDKKNGSQDKKEQLSEGEETGSAECGSESCARENNEANEEKPQDLGNGHC